MLRYLGPPGSVQGPRALCVHRGKESTGPRTRTVATADVVFTGPLLALGLLAPGTFLGKASQIPTLTDV